MKYQSKIVGLGPDALAFLDDEDMNFIIIFTLIMVFHFIFTLVKM